MKKIVAFGASNSKKSINKRLASFAACQLKEVETIFLDLNDYEMPIYGEDREQKDGIPKEASIFKQQLIQADGIIISFAENNGSYSSAFKNIFDWVSRVSSDSIWEQKQMFLLATAPGARGGKTVLDLALKTFPFQGAKIAASFSLPFFSKNFVPEKGISNSELQHSFQEQVQKFQESLL